MKRELQSFISVTSFAATVIAYFITVDFLLLKHSQ